MSHWRVHHIALLWLGAALLTVGVIAFDVWRVREFAIAVPGRPSVWRIGALVRAAAPVLPFATGAAVILPGAALVCTVWWAVLQMRGR